MKIKEVVQKFLGGEGTIGELSRKFNKYKEYCRLYEELYRELQTKNGESTKANTVLNSETKESGSMLSIELEPEKSE